MKRGNGFGWRAKVVAVIVALFAMLSSLVAAVAAFVYAAVSRGMVTCC